MRKTFLKQKRKVLPIKWKTNPLKEQTINLYNLLISQYFKKEVTKMLKEREKKKESRRKSEKINNENAM